MLKRLITVSVLIMLAGLFASFLATQAGNSVIEWLGYKIEIRTSLLITGLACLVLLVLLLDRVLSYFVMLPSRLIGGVRRRRHKEGEHAVALGLVAAAVGDSSEAAKQARRARKLTGPSTLTGLLDAQVATLKGNTEAASRFFESLTDNRATAWLGHAGEMRLKAEAGESVAALEAGRAAFARRRNEPGLARALFVLEAQEGNWQGAIDALEVAMRHAKAGTERREAETAMAVLYHQLAQERYRTAGDGDGGDEAGNGDDRALALKDLQKALQHDPGLVPAALRAAELLKEDGKGRKATTLLEKAFLACPHPDLAALLIELWPGNETANLAKLMRLADRGGNSREAIGACADIAARLRLWGEARRLAERIPETERDAGVWSVLAEIGRNSPKGPSRETRDWPVTEDCLNRAAAAPRPAGWACGKCGHLADRWHPHCPDCEGFAALEWQR